jgi:hypothetical protein
VLFLMWHGVEQLREDIVGPALLVAFPLTRRLFS